MLQRIWGGGGQYLCLLFCRFFFKSFCWIWHWILGVFVLAFLLSLILCSSAGFCSGTWWIRGGFSVRLSVIYSLRLCVWILGIWWWLFLSGSLLNSSLDFCIWSLFLVFGDYYSVIFFLSCSIGFCFAF